MSNRTRSFSADFACTHGTDYTPATPDRLGDDRDYTISADALQSSVLTRHDGARFACLELICRGSDGAVRGLHFLLTPDGARAIAETLQGIAAEIDAEAAAQAQQLLARIATGKPE